MKLRVVTESQRSNKNQRSNKATLKMTKQKEKNCRLNAHPSSKNNNFLSNV